MKTTTTKTTANEMRFIGPSSHLAEEHPVDMVALNLTNRNRKEAGPLGGLREQYENVRGKVGELEHIGNLGNWVKLIVHRLSIVQIDYYNVKYTGVAGILLDCHTI